MLRNPNNSSNSKDGYSKSIVLSSSPVGKDGIMGRIRIWLPEKEAEIPSTTDAIEIGVKLAGHYHLQLLDKDTREVQKELSFSNVLTDTFMNAMGNGGSAGSSLMTGYLQYCQVGVGSVAGASAPSGTDTTLNNPIGDFAEFGTFPGQIADRYPFTAKGVTGSISGSYFYVHSTYEFLETQANGNLTEIGILSDDSPVTLMSRSAIKDSSGTPVTLSKTSDNLLRVHYELRLYPPTASITGSVIVGPTTHSYYMMPMGIWNNNVWGYSFTDNSGELGKLPTWVSGTLAALETRSFAPVTQSFTYATIPFRSSASYQNYANGTYYREITHTFTGPLANFPTGIGYMAWSKMTNADTSPFFQMKFVPSIPKTSGQQLTLKLRYAFSRH
jgi:hypothetical protein